MTAVFLRVVEAADKDAALLELIRDPRSDSGCNRFEVDPTTFRQVPKSPFAYWVSDALREKFRELRPFGSEDRFAYSGTSTGNDERFTRQWWEVSPTAARWRNYTKGGRRSPYYADVSTVIDWRADGLPIELSYAGGRVRKVHFFRQGMSWPLRGARFSAYAVPSGCVFGTAGKVALASQDELPRLLALMNSRPFDFFIGVFAGNVRGAQYEVGLIQSVPVPSKRPDAEASLTGLARRAWSLKRGLDTFIETSHAFVLPALVQVGGKTLAERTGAWVARVRDAEAELASLQEDIDELCFAAYGIDSAERQKMERGLGTDRGGIDGGSGEAGSGGASPEEIDAGPMVASLLSWSVGVAMGRFDVRLATGTRAVPGAPEAFDPLPACSPGMLTAGDDRPASEPPTGYALAFAADGILVEDLGHERDLAAATRLVFDQLFDDPAWRWQEAAELLDSRGHDLRTWFGRSFFEFHLKLYSKSPRKAPIYWQLATPSASYAVWLYTQRFTGDTFFKVLNDHATPKLLHEERKLTGLKQDAGQNPSKSQRKEIDAQERFVAELRVFREEVTRVAPLWNPNLNDGVIINFAPLWRLVPHHRAWQRECKRIWDKLCMGAYDWAHLAMHLWPERVVPKCAEDRSLAIAHDLEDVFWQEDLGGKWQAQEVQQAKVEALVRKRTSDAVKGALNSLSEAPPLSASDASKKTPPRAKAATKRAVPPRPAVTGRLLRGRSTASADRELLDKVRDAIAAKGDGASRADVLEATGITSGQWNTAIKALLGDGSVTRTGERRGARYQLAGGAA